MRMEISVSVGLSTVFVLQILLLFIVSELHLLE